MIFNKTRKYFQEKVRIDKKANQSTAYKIQVYNNAKVDELVKRYNEGETVNIKTPPSMLWAELSILNKPEVYKNYNKIINSKYTSNDNIDKIIIKNKANKDLNRIVEAEVERISKNLDYVNQVMQKYEIPQKQYEEFKRKQQNNSIANRQEILKQVAIKNNEILASEGLNIPSNVFSYRNLDLTAETLLRQSQMQSKHEEVNSINQHYINQGKDKVYTGKEWIWTGRGKTTRHRSNHLQKRAVNEPFIIVNDKTLHIDEMMYPSDPAGSFSNAFICYCEVEYLTDYDEYKENLFGLHPTTYKPTTTAYQSPTFMNAKQLKAQLKQPSPVKISQPIGTNIKDYMNVTVADPVIQAIDDTVDGVESIPHNYVIDGNLVDIVYHDGDYYYNGLMLKEYDPVTKIGKVSKSAVTKHNNSIIVDAQPKGSFIDLENDINIKYAFYEDEGAKGQLWLDEDEGAYKNSNGEWEYNGLVADVNYNAYGKWDLDSIIEHNKQFADTIETNVDTKPKGDFIDTDMQMLKDNFFAEAGVKGQYWLDENDGAYINSDGKWEYNGLVADDAHNSNSFGKWDLDSIIEHNKQFTDATQTTDNVTATNKEVIDLKEIENSLYKDVSIEHGDQYWLDESNGAYINENGNWEYKGLEADGKSVTGDFGKWDVESIAKHNYELTGKQDDTDTINNIKDTVQSTSNQQISNEVDNNTIIDTATSNKQYIDTSILHADSDGDYDIDPSLYPELKDDIKVNANGELTYKGLKLHEYSSIEGGYLKPDEIEQHNKQFADTNVDESISVVYNKPVKEQINPNHLEYDYDINAYIVNEFDGVVKYNGDYYYKGLKIEGYNPATKEGIIKDTVIQNHNIQAQQTNDNSTETNVANKEYIDVDDLIASGSEYLINLMHGHKNNDYITQIGDKYYYKGLEVKMKFHEDGEPFYAKISTEKIEEHNKQLVDGNIIELNKEVIDLDKISDLYDPSKEAYMLATDDEDDVVHDSTNNKYYYKGLEVKNENGILYAKEDDIKQHNKQISESEDKYTPPKTQIQKVELYDFGDDTYGVGYHLVKEINGEHYLNGLKLEKGDYNGFDFKVTLEEINQHNASLNIKEDVTYVKKTTIIQREEINSREAYAINEQTGEKYRIDKRSESERKQDELQNQVDMSEHKTGMYGWALPRYDEINSLVLGIDGASSSFDGTPYKDLMQKKAFPLLDKYYEEVDKTKRTDTPKCKRLLKDYEKIVKEAHEIEDSRYNQRQLEQLMWDLVDMESALAKSPPLHENVMFIREGHWEKEWNKVGEIFEFEPYSSTTYKEHGAGFGGSRRYWITILAPKGTRGTRMNGQYNSLQGEREWLLKRHQRFRVLEFDEENRNCVIELLPD